MNISLDEYLYRRMITRAFYQSMKIQHLPDILSFKTNRYNNGEYLPDGWFVYVVVTPSSPKVMFIKDEDYNKIHAMDTPQSGIDFELDGEVVDTFIIDTPNTFILK